MDMKTKFLVIKLSSKDGQVVVMNMPEIINRASGDWRISYNAVAKVTHAIIMFQGLILAECEVGPTLMMDRDTGRMTFDLKMVDHSKLAKRLMSAYKAPNPVSVKTLGEIETLISQSK